MEFAQGNYLEEIVHATTNFLKDNKGALFQLGIGALEIYLSFQIKPNVEITKEQHSLGLLAVTMGSCGAVNSIYGILRFLMPNYYNAKKIATIESACVDTVYKYFKRNF